MKCWSTPMQGKRLGLALLIAAGFRVSFGGFNFAECFKGKILACSQADDGRFAIIFNRLRISLNRIKMDMWPDRVPGQSEKENTLTPHKSSLKLLGQEFLHGLMSPLWQHPCGPLEEGAGSQGSAVPAAPVPIWPYGKVQEAWLDWPQNFLTREHGLSSHLGDCNLWFASRAL